MSFFSAAPLQHRKLAMEEYEVTTNNTTKLMPPTILPNNETITDTPVTLDEILESDSLSTEDRKSTNPAISAEIAPQTPNEEFLIMWSRLQSQRKK